MFEKKTMVLSVKVVGFALLSGLVCACMGEVPAERLSTLKVHAQPADTKVYVNGSFAGRASVLQKVGKALRPGVQYVTFVAPGHFPHDVRVELPPGETVIDMKLRPIPQ